LDGADIDDRRLGRVHHRRERVGASVRGRGAPGRRRRGRWQWPRQAVQAAEIHDGGDPAVTASGTYVAAPRTFAMMNGRNPRPAVPASGPPMKRSPGTNRAAKTPTGP
jgi:hypothetical protein